MSQNIQIKSFENFPVLENLDHLCIDRCDFESLDGLAVKFPMLTILEASFNSIENSDKIQDLDDMTILAEINLEGNPIVNTYTF